MDREGKSHQKMQKCQEFCSDLPLLKEGGREGMKPSEIRSQLTQAGHLVGVYDTPPPTSSPDQVSPTQDSPGHPLSRPPQLGVLREVWLRVCPPHPSTQCPSSRVGVAYCPSRGSRGVLDIPPSTGPSKCRATRQALTSEGTAEADQAKFKPLGK